MAVELMAYTATAAPKYLNGLDAKNAIPVKWSNDSHRTPTPSETAKTSSEAPAGAFASSASLSQALNREPMTRFRYANVMSHWSPGNQNPCSNRLRSSRRSLSSRLLQHG